MTDNNNTNNNLDSNEQKNDILNEDIVQQPEAVTSNSTNTVGTESETPLKPIDNRQKIESLKSFKKWMNITYILSIIGIVFMVIGCFVMPLYIIIAVSSGFLAYLLYKIIDETNIVIKKLENNEDVLEDNYIGIILKVKNYFKWSFIISISTVILVIIASMIFFIFFATSFEQYMNIQ